MRVEDFLTRLESVRHVGRGYRARCPAHPDHSPSLSIRDGDWGILLRCWAGCALREITSALGLSITDLFFDAPISGGRSPTPKSPKLDLVAIAFHFELAALDRRERAKRVRQAINSLSVSNLTENDRNRLKDAEVRAQADSERAELFEGVADNLRWRAFIKQKGR
jgi:hypothetical protein